MLQALRNRLGPVARIVMIFALAAMSVRALTPSGYMAARTDGGFTVALCGSGQVVTLDLDGDRDHQQNTGEGGEACSFAVAAVAAPPPLLSGSALAPPFAEMTALAVFPSQVAVGQGLAAPPPPSHAPPNIV